MPQRRDLRSAAGANCLRALAPPDARRHRHRAGRRCGPRPAARVRRLGSGPRPPRLPGWAEGRGSRRARRRLVPRRRGRGARDRRAPPRREPQHVRAVARDDGEPRWHRTESAKERPRRRPQPQLLRRLEGELGHLERLLPGPEAVLRARVARRQAPRQADRARPLDLLPPAVEPGARLVQGARPRAAPLREPREHGVRMPRRRPARHRDEVVQPQARPPSVRGRAGSRRALVIERAAKHARAVTNIARPG